MSKEANSTFRALKLALEALKELVAQTETGLFAVRHDHVAMQDARQAITALREALTSVPDWASEAKEQPAQQKPVACQYAQDVAMPEYRCIGRCQYDTSPPALSLAQRQARSADTWVNATTWRGLTDEELSEVYNQADWDTVNGWEYERAIEARLRSKNEDRN